MNALFPPPHALITVDKGIPLPAPAAGGRKYPFKELEVGDSFFAPGKTRENLRALLSRNSCECVRFSTRHVVENGVKGVRVWRVL